MFPGTGSGKSFAGERLRGRLQGRSTPPGNLENSETRVDGLSLGLGPTSSCVWFLLLFLFVRLHVRLQAVHFWAKRCLRCHTSWVGFEVRRKSQTMVFFSQFEDRISCDSLTVNSSSAQGVSRPQGVPLRFFQEKRLSGLTLQVHMGNLT